MKILLYISLFIVFVGLNHSRKTGHPSTYFLDSTLFVTYNKGYSDIGTNLTLNKNWTFLYEDYYYSDYILEGEPSGWITQITGRFEIDSNKLYLFPIDFLSKELFSDSIVIIDNTDYNDNDSMRIQKEYTIVKWTGNIYLLSEEVSRDLRFRSNNDFEKFADNYNSGAEPRWSGKYFAYRVNKRRNEILNKNQIPSRWRDYFLDSMISLVVTDIEEDIAYDSLFNSTINQFKLNGGYNVGVREGMTFYGSDNCCILKIMNVETEKSYGLIELCPNQQKACKIGDTVTTWNMIEYEIYVP